MARKQRIICLLLAAWMVFCLSACKGNDSGSSNANPPANSTGENQQGQSGDGSLQSGDGSLIDFPIDPKLKSIKEPSPDCVA